MTARVTARLTTRRTAQLNAGKCHGREPMRQFDSGGPVGAKGGSHIVQPGPLLGKDASIPFGVDITEFREAVARPLPESSEVIACLMSRARAGPLDELSVQGLAETAEGFPRGLALVLDFLGSPFYLLDRLPLFIHDAPSRGDTRNERGEGGGVGRGWTALSHAATVAPRTRAAKVGQAGYDFRSRHGAV